MLARLAAAEADEALEGGARVFALEIRLGCWGVLPVDPGLPGPVRRLRIAWAPKLMRRAKGEVAPVLEDSSSSMALSSINSELLVEILPLRIPNVAFPELGDVPDSPTVVTDSRRRWSLAAANVTDSRLLPLPAEVELLRWKRLENVAEVIEPRRSLEGPLVLSFDMLILVNDLVLIA